MSKKGKSNQKEGWLHKHGKEVFSGWQYRFFRLEGTQLNYYKDEKAKQPVGSIDLSLGIHF